MVTGAGWLLFLPLQEVYAEIVIGSELPQMENY